MARTRTAPWDYKTKEYWLCEANWKVTDLIEDGRQIGLEEAGCLIQKLRLLDPQGWEVWYDKTIPEVVSIAEVDRMLSDRINDLTFDPMKAEGYESPMEIRASLGL